MFAPKTPPLSSIAMLYTNNERTIRVYKPGQLYICLGRTLLYSRYVRQWNQIPWDDVRDDGRMALCGSALCGATSVVEIYALQCRNGTLFYNSIG